MYEELLNENPQHMFWLRNKKIIFLVHTLNSRPGHVIEAFPGHYFWFSTKFMNTVGMKTRSRFYVQLSSLFVSEHKYLNWKHLR